MQRFAKDGLPRPHRFLRRLHRAGRDETGVAALEFALVAPVFLVLVFAIIVYSLYIGTRFALTEAAAEGARASVAGMSAADRTTYATARAQAVIASYAPLMSVANATITTSAPAAGVFQVSISYNRTTLGLTGFSSLLPLPPAVTTAQATVSNGGY